MKINNEIKKVSISPMVLLSVVDHYKRQSYPRVLGICLGKRVGSEVIITNSFAFPFEETSEKYYIESSYVTKMYKLFHKVDNKETIVGWYHSGGEGISISNENVPNTLTNENVGNTSINENVQTSLRKNRSSLQKNDLEITKSLQKICGGIEQMVLCVVNIDEKDVVPAQMFYYLNGEMECINQVIIGADENEEIGVEHLLRDIKTSTGTTKKDRLNIIKQSLIKFSDSLESIISYIDKTFLNEHSLTKENSLTKEHSSPKENSSSSSSLNMKHNLKSKRILNEIYEIMNLLPKESTPINLKPILNAELINTFVSMNDLYNSKQKE